MNIKITSTNIDVSPMVEDYVSKKMLSLSKFLNNDEDVLCEVELIKTTNHHKSGDIYGAEVNILYEGKQFYVVAENNDLYASIDEMRDEVERVILSKKEKNISLFRRGASKIKNIVKNLYH